MRQVHTLPLCLALALVTVAAVLALCPSWAAAVGLDLWNVPTTGERMDDEARRGERLDEELSRPRERLTEHTITDRRALEDDLRRVRERGYATAIDELEFGLTAIAAPVRDADGLVIATISGSPAPDPSRSTRPSRRPCSWPSRGATA